MHNAAGGANLFFTNAPVRLRQVAHHLEQRLNKFLGQPRGSFALRVEVTETRCESPVKLMTEQQAEQDKPGL